MNLRKFIHYFIEHSVIANWLMIVICGFGIFALASLNKRISPKMEIQEVEIDLPYPGASARDNDSLRCCVACVDEMAGSVDKIVKSVRPLVKFAIFVPVVT